jgi:hypothetical protein
MCMASSPRPRQHPRSLPSIASTTTTKLPPLPLEHRLLFPSLPPSSPLPPLLSSQDISNELYHLIALSLRAFVNPWWTKITRYDKEFLPEINRLLTIVIRALEARLVVSDLSPLILHDIPLLITQHYRDIRDASSKLSSSYAYGGSASLPILFHQSQPHMAITSDGESINEVYIRQIVDHVLKSCLPPEDYAPEAERFIVREVVLKVLVQDIIPKITEPWFLHKVVLDLLGPVELTKVCRLYQFGTAFNLNAARRHLPHAFILIPHTHRFIPLRRANHLRDVSSSDPSVQTSREHHQSSQPPTHSQETRFSTASFPSWALRIPILRLLRLIPLPNSNTTSRSRLRARATHDDRRGIHHARPVRE